MTGARDDRNGAGLVRDRGKPNKDIRFGDAVVAKKLFLPPEEAVVRNGGTLGRMVVNGTTSGAGVDPVSGAGVDPVRKTVVSVERSDGLYVVDLKHYY